jgi:hypothetical protein
VALFLLLLVPKMISTWVDRQWLKKSHLVAQRINESGSVYNKSGTAAAITAVSSSASFATGHFAQAGGVCCI